MILCVRFARSCCTLVDLCYRAVCHPHSFPTRRSSDLVCSPGSRGKNWSSPGFIRSQINPDASRMLRFLGSVTIVIRSEEHTSELQSRGHLVCRLLLEKKNFVIKDRKCGYKSEAVKIAM